MQKCRAAVAGCYLLQVPASSVDRGLRRGMCILISGISSASSCSAWCQVRASREAVVRVAASSSNQTRSKPGLRALSGTTLVILSVICQIQDVRW